MECHSLISSKGVFHHEDIFPTKGRDKEVTNAVHFLLSRPHGNSSKGTNLASEQPTDENICFILLPFKARYLCIALRLINDVL
jgi:hypothetical protein